MSMECHIRAMPGFLVVRPVESDPQTKGGIYLPDGARENPNRGIVLDVGCKPDKQAYNCIPVAPGEMVLFVSHRGHEVTIEGARYLVLRADDVIGAFEAKQVSVEA